MTVTPDAAPARLSLADTLAVYLKPRVLIVLFLGFSAGLPFSVAGQTLQAWMTETGVDIRTIGLFAAVGTPYWAKPLWAPAVDALDVPLLSRLLGRRRGWLMLTQILLVGAIILLALFLTLRVRPLLAVPLAIVLPVVIHLIFYKMLRVPLPWGVLPVLW